ncbi:ZIP family metal transporter [Ferviditalea candida]|uniref:ZIP family metal transporter n=1 Tax=Ferviditalea candida TaxID=3108399 RepID=A0ABU5ZNG7_9BACL|nr:ZIP family metal transporter [Paenibacillaceae bacterium T2]
MEYMLAGSGFSSLCTVIGAFPALFFRNISYRGKDMLLAFTAGSMITASIYSLIPSALKISNLFVITTGILLGTMILTLIELNLPELKPGNSLHPSLDAKSVMFLIAITLHNLPEGLSVGVSYASQYRELGPLVSIAFGLQNMPEGFLIALFLVTNRIDSLKAFFFTTVTAALEFLFAVLGYLFTDKVKDLVPYGLSFAAGAMLYVVVEEIMPESYENGHEKLAAFSFIFGLLTMIIFTHLFEG